MKYVSSKTDPKKSHYDYYGWVETKGGRIVEIGHELGREGGVLWSPKFNNNGNKKSCMASIGRTWPNLYTKVRNACPKEGLPTISVVQRKAKQRQMEILEERVRRQQKELNSTRAELEKLKKSL